MGRRAGGEGRGETCGRDKGRDLWQGGGRRATRRLTRAVAVRTSCPRGSPFRGGGATRRERGCMGGGSMGRLIPGRGGKGRDLWQGQGGEHIPRGRPIHIPGPAAPGEEDGPPSKGWGCPPQIALCLLNWRTPTPGVIPGGEMCPRGPPTRVVDKELFEVK